MKLKYIIFLVGLSISGILSAAKLVDSCPSTPLTAPCIEVHNSGSSKEIVVSLQTAEELSLKVLPGDTVSYTFPTLEVFTGFSLEAVAQINALDSSCSAYPWAIILKEGKPFIVNNLTNIIYSYSYGLEENDQGLKLVNCA